MKYQRTLILFSLMFLLLFSSTTTAFASDGDTNQIPILEENYLLIVDSSENNWIYNNSNDFIVLRALADSYDEKMPTIIYNNEEKAFGDIFYFIRNNGTYSVNYSYIDDNNMTYDEYVPTNIESNGNLILNFTKNENYKYWDKGNATDLGDSFSISIPVSFRSNSRTLIPSIKDGEVLEFKKYTWTELDEDGFKVNNGAQEQSRVTFTNNLGDVIRCKVEYSQINYRRGYNVINYKAIPSNPEIKKDYDLYEGNYIVFMNVKPQIKVSKNSVRIYIGRGNNTKEEYSEYQYKIDKGKWITIKDDYTTIKNLKPNTKYKLQVRQIATDDHPEVILYNKTIKTKKK